MNDYVCVSLNVDRGSRPSCLLEFIKWMNSYAEQVPPEFRNETSIDLCGGHEEGHYIEIWYRRPKTDADFAEERAKKVAREEKRKVDELSLLAELKAKYER